MKDLKFLKSGQIIPKYFHFTIDQMNSNSNNESCSAVNSWNKTYCTNIVYTSKLRDKSMSRAEIYNISGIGLHRILVGGGGPEGKT